jgi:DNA mismatch repair protein MutL
MPKIVRLSSRTIDRIAAGEVVERPASVVKELVENALDAGATRIEIEIAGGGVESILVRDNGAGMPREDAVLAVERHATSKIRTEEDLARVASFGFRGEALPSIASVSRFTLTTGDGTSEEATRLSVDFGAPVNWSPAAHPRGTDVRVEDLFRKTPARRKFLKSPEAEAREIARLVSRTAIAHPGVAFTLVANGKEILSAAPASERSTRISDVYGREALGDLLSFEAAGGPYRLSGYVTRGSVTFATRRLQFFFVNSRPVDDRGVSRAISQAARESIRTDRHPAVFLYLTAPEGTVDVNVSPSKTEVRFTQASEVFRLVFHALLSALTSGKEARRLAAVPRTDFSVAEATGIYAFRPERKPAAAAPKLELNSVPESPFGKTAPEPPPPAAPAVRCLGQYDDSYLVVEGEEGLLILDQHAAHERVLYERIRARVEKGKSYAQRLLTPATFVASAEEALAIGGSAPALTASGFEIEEMSGLAFSISTVAPEAAGRDPVALVREIVAGLLTEERDPGRRIDRVHATVACRSAVTIHHRLSSPEIDRLVLDWSRCVDRFTCPHGRPVALSLSEDDLLKFFKRK